MKESTQCNTDVMEELQLKIQSLEKENRLLKERLDEACISYADIALPSSDNAAEIYDPNQGARIKRFEVTDKIASDFFMMFCRGRKDVYDLRYTNPKTGRTKKRKSLIGNLQGAHDTLTGIVDVAMIRSLKKKDGFHPLLKEYAQVYFDECHHAASDSAIEILQEINAKYVYGVTATPKRLSKTPYGNDAYELIRNNDVRDEQIIRDVANCVQAGRTPVILTKYVDHAKKLSERLKNHADRLILLTGSDGTKARRAQVEELNAVDDAESLILVGTGSLLGEGFDFPRLDTLFMATPVSGENVVEQYVGRLNRDYEGKENVIVYDYVDSHIPKFDKMYAARLKAYKKSSARALD